jgi:hypothetical protein
VRRESVSDDSPIPTPRRSASRLNPATLPHNVTALRSLLLQRQDEHAAELQAAHNGLKEQVLRNEQLKLRVARLLRERFGASSEKLRGAIEQLDLILGDLEEQVAQTTPPEPNEAARSRAPGAWRLVDIAMDEESSTFIDTLNRQKLRKLRRRKGRYLLRTNLTENDPALLWQYYIQLVAVEQAFRNLKGDLAIRPIFHQDERRIEAHIFIAFLAYCLQITLQCRLHALASGLTARSALETLAAVQMIDVHLPTTDGRELRLTRYIQPAPDLQLLIRQLKLQLPPQPPPRIATAAVTRAT